MKQDSYILDWGIYPTQQINMSDRIISLAIECERKIFIDICEQMKIEINDINGKRFCAHYREGNKDDYDITFDGILLGNVKITWPTGPDYKYIIEFIPIKNER